MSLKNVDPFISFVLVGRNDNYGGDFRHRLQQCVSNLFKQLERYNIEAEIIFINYNPLPSPDIIDFIDWPQSTDSVRIKVITVPPQGHHNFVADNNVKDVPVLEYPAKNIGIKRAGGEYIACINPDILFDDKIIRGLKKTLDKKLYFRANRVDYKLDKNHKKILRIHMVGHTFPLKKVSKVNLYLLTLKAKLVNFVQSKTVFFESLLSWLEIDIIYDNAELKYHCNTSGDLMIMHRENWDKLKAYKENAYLALHIDSLMVIQAASMGLNEYVFKDVIYHQDHESRYDAKKENDDFRNAYINFQRDAQKMLKDKKALVYNNSNWGFAEVKLDELVL